MPLNRGYFYSQVLIFIFFFYIFSCMPLMVDDIWRSQLAALYNHTVIANLIHDYMTHTGRLSAKFLGSIFLNKPMPYMITIADVISALSFNVLIIYMYKIITGKAKIAFDKEYVSYLSIFFFIFTFSAFIGTTMWKMVAIEYLWGISVCTYLAYKLLYKEHISIFLAIFSSVFIGLYNEQVFAFCFILLFVFAVYNYKTNYLNRNIIIMLLLLFIFGLVDCLAPGNIYRAQEEVMKFGFNTYIDELITIFLAIFRGILILPFLIWSFKSTTSNQNLKNIQKVAIKAALILTFLVALMFFRYAGTGRVYMVYIILYFCIICFNTNMVDRVTNGIRLKKILYTFSILAVALLLFGSSYIHYEFNKRLKYMDDHINQSVCLNEIYSPVWYLIYFKDFDAYGDTKGENGYGYRNYNHDYAKYYNLKKIRYCK
ncbi:DUF6056 family protein [Francisella sp. 19X1-34]|uniref:DUF6056 family protein n=1 Tax=Francisella sp. 19X1-34 TaxID=3087177 RepID=UPI002E338395|nr:DUF6056 family protein [Francisella sp. 19X1-34]MED7787580.1 DUF6056 family protein [Francisella sp. 19X1-34]